MIGTSKLEYYFIRFCILGLHYIAPICILYCVLLVSLYGFKAATYRFPLLVETGAVAETLFYLLIYLPYRRHLQREAIHPPPPTREERQELFQLCNDNISDPETYLRKWFLGAELREIKRENLKDFFLWAFFNRGGPPGDDDEELEGYVSATEKMLGRPIPEGRGTAKPLRLTIDKVDMLHRSLIWYLCVGFVDFLTYSKMLLHGFSFHRTSVKRFFTLFPLRPYSLLTRHRSPVRYTTYWHRPHTSKTKLPIVFIHGIGIGLYPYTNFLSELNSSSGVESSNPEEQVGIIAIEIMPVAFRITHSALSRDAMCAEITAIVTHHFGDTKFLLCSHSYGSVISTHLVHYTPIAPLIGPIVLIDPVSILLHLPDVAYNFTRRPPTHANEFQLYYFASMDSGVAHTLARHFFWNENVLWKKDLKGKKVTVSLGGRDLIVNTEAVGRYLSEPVKGYENGVVKGNGNAGGADALIDLGEPSDDVESGRRLRGAEGTDDKNDSEEWKYRAWKGEGIDVLWFPDLDHAQVFDKPASRKRVINCIRAYCEDV